ncbi:unnamed protein product, partial [Closterium sp. Naga37s-1]
RCEDHQQRHERVVVRSALEAGAIRGQRAGGASKRGALRQRCMAHGRHREPQQRSWLRNMGYAFLCGGGNNFVAMGIRFENTAPASMEAAVAFRSAGDKTIAYRCVFSGFQDTLNSHRGRQYYRNCAIYGHVDFIYGRHGAAVFDRCRIVPLARPGENGAATIATHGGETRSKREGGFVFYRCWIAGNAPGVTVYLGRPWRAHARAVYMFSYLSNAVLPEGWVPWPGESFGPKAFLGEYQNTGPGAGMSGRARWVRPGLLSEAQVAPFMPEAFIRGSRWVGKTPVEIVYP